MDSPVKRPLKKRIKYTLIYWFALALINLSNLFPRKWVLRFTGSLGRLAYKLFKEARQIAINNLTRVFHDKMSPDQIQALSKEVFEMIGRNAGDIIRAQPINSLEALSKFIKVEGEEHLEAACAKNNGVIIVTAHIGAFELIGSYLGLKGYRPHGVGTALKDERLNELLVNYRTSRGIIAIERGKETFRMLKTLKKGGMVAILSDQDTRVKSRFINFMGRPAATPIGGTLLAQKTGASVVPIYIHLQPDLTQKISIYPEVALVGTGNEEEDLIENTQRISDTTEKAILENPAQWVWIHDRWKTRPGDEIR
jgi:KDO2-lipid IV(A) lauroyltransferase